MQVSSRFTIAVHILACIEYFGKDYKLTSDFLAGSIGINSVNVRKILQRLSAAGIITVKRGTGGITVNRDYTEISLYDLFAAVGSLEDRRLFRFHDRPNPACPVGGNIHRALDEKLNNAQRAMEEELKRTPVSEVIREIHAANQEKKTPHARRS
jgi:DNA-binding IscR family transcriptional regulator